MKVALLKGLVPYDMHGMHMYRMVAFLELLLA